MTEGGAAWENFGYQSQFAARKAVLFAMVDADWSYEDAYRYILTDATRPVYDLWTTDKGDNRVKLLISDWNQVTAFHAEHARERPDVLAVCGVLRMRAAYWDWKGVSGRTDRDVLLVELEFAESSSSLTVRMACREVANRAGISRPTASRALGRLTGAGWHEPTRDRRTWVNGVPQGIQYRLRTDGGLLHEGLLHSETNLESFYPNSEFVSSCNNMAATELADYLGKAGMAVLMAVDTEPRRAARVAERAHVCRSTATRQLKVLLREGLVENPAPYWIIGPKDPGTYDPGTHKVAEKIARHERQRETYREVINEYRRAA